MNKINKNLILLVDDDKFLLDMYSTKFIEDGNEVEVSLKGQNALDRLRKGLKASVILLDIVMPNIDGFTLLETIKKEKLGDNPTVIMLTNQGEQTDIEKAKKLGADGYIIKASSIPSEVLERINKIVNDKK